MPRSLSPNAIGSLALCLLTSCILLAQSEAVNARLSGIVLDPDSAPVPVAKVTLSNPAAGLFREFTTGVDGQYTFSSIPPGQYRLRVEKEGFTTYLQPNLVLAVAQSSVLDPKLEVGSISQVVEVGARLAPHIQ